MAGAVDRARRAYALRVLVLAISLGLITGVAVFVVVPPATAETFPTPNTRVDDSLLDTTTDFQPALAASGSSVYLAYSTIFDIKFARSDDGGSSWFGWTLVSDNPGDGSIRAQPDLAVAPNGTAYVVWVENRNSPPCSPGSLHVFASRSADGCHPHPAQPPPTDHRERPHPGPSSPSSSFGRSCPADDRGFGPPTEPREGAERTRSDCLARTYKRTPPQTSAEPHPEATMPAGGVPGRRGSPQRGARGIGGSDGRCLPTEEGAAAGAASEAIGCPAAAFVDRRRGGARSGTRRHRSRRSRRHRTRKRRRGCRSRTASEHRDDVVVHREPSHGCPADGLGPDVVGHPQGEAVERSAGSRHGVDDAI